MLTIPPEYTTKCEKAGKVSTLNYGEKSLLLYSPIEPATHILYLIHGGGGDQNSFFRPEFLNMVDHMIDSGILDPLYIVSPCFYDPTEKDKSPASSGVAVKKFCKELREQILPLVESHIGASFAREKRAISGFSMGGVTTWYAFLQALDLFYWFLPLSGDCWACGETGGGKYPEKTAMELVSAVSRHGSPDCRIHAITGSKDIAFPNLDAQIKAMGKYPAVFGDKLKYEVLKDGIHDYETIFQYLFNALPALFSGTETQDQSRQPL